MALAPACFEPFDENVAPGDRGPDDLSHLFHGSERCQPLEKRAGIRPEGLDSDAPCREGIAKRSHELVLREVQEQADQSHAGVEVSIEEQAEILCRIGVLFLDAIEEVHHRLREIVPPFRLDGRELGKDLFEGLAMALHSHPEDQVLVDQRSMDGGVGPEVIPVLFLEDRHRGLVLPHELHQDVEVRVSVRGVGEGEDALSEV